MTAFGEMSTIASVNASPFPFMFWSDNETKNDLVGLDHLVNVVATLVRQDTLHPSTIGVYGDWGTGKSSLLRMVEEEICDEDTLVLWFNGWQFEGFDDAKSALLNAILEQLALEKTLSQKGKGLAKKLIKRVNWMRVIGMAATGALSLSVDGLPALGVAAGLELPELALLAAQNISETNIETLIREKADESRVGIREFRDDFEALLDETTRKRLVVIIDDLDRCNPRFVVETLEAIKLFLAVPQTVFILGADERLVRAAVRTEFPEFTENTAEVGRDYLEKIIQFPVQIPPVGMAATEAYIFMLLGQHVGIEPDSWNAIREQLLEDGKNSLFQRRIDRASIIQHCKGRETAIDEALALAQQISPVFAAEVGGNPRRCKQFLNTLVMRQIMAQSRGLDLSSRVLAKLMLLEYFRKEHYHQLSTEIASNKGKSFSLRDFEKSSQAGAGTGTKPPKKTKHATAKSLPDWMTDPWIVGWLEIEPKLGHIDLSPYIYVSKNIRGAINQTAQRLSDEAHDLLEQLFSASAATRRLAITNSEHLESADILALVENIAARFPDAEDLAEDPSPLSILLDLCRPHPTIFTEVLGHIQRIPTQRIPFALPVKLVELSSSSNHEESLLALFESWSSSSTPGLVSSVNIAKQRLM